MKSIDPPRRRSAPAKISGHDTRGNIVEFAFVATSLVLVVKANCGACEELLAAGPEVFGGFDVAYVAADDSVPAHDFGREILVSSSGLAALDVRWPPAYLVVDPVVGEVIGEGVVFDAAQVRSEIARFLVA